VSVKLSSKTNQNPTANIVGITSIDENRDLFKYSWDQTMERQHPVAGEQEISVNIEVAAVIFADFGTKLRHDSLLIQILADPAKSGIAQVARVLTFSAHIIDIVPGLLIRTNQCIIAVDAGRDARPNALRVVAVLNELLAAWQGVIHGLAFALIKYAGPCAVTASLRPVVCVLRVTIGETVTNQNRLYVDIPLLV
jgi:hypothetical protein